MKEGMRCGEMILEISGAGAELLKEEGAIYGEDYGAYNKRIKRERGFW